MNKPEFTLTFSEQDLAIIGHALQGVAYQHAAPLVKKIEEQVNKQIAEAAAAAEAAALAGE